MGLFGLGKKTDSDGGEVFGGKFGFVIKGINVYENYAWSAILYADELVLKCIAKAAKDTEFVIKTSNIIDVEYSVDVEKFTKQKSSLIKSVIGGAVAGVPGAIVGAAPKEKTTRDIYGSIFIEYKSSSGEIKELLIRDNFASRFHAAKLFEAIKAKLPTQDIPTGRTEL